MEIDSDEKLLINSVSQNFDNEQEISLSNSESYANLQEYNSNLTLESSQNYIWRENKLVRINCSVYCSPLIEYERMRFLIMEQPAPTNTTSFVDLLLKHQVKHLVRVCKPGYPSDKLYKESISTYDLPFPDGGYPSDDIIIKWINILSNVFNKYPGCTIGVHCAAGFGRAPLMVAIALIESGMKPTYAIDYVRYFRRGAINNRQYDFLCSYKAMGNLRIRSPSKMCRIF